MADRPGLPEILDLIEADARDLHRALRTNTIGHVQALTARITDAQTLSHTALQLFVNLTQQPLRSAPAHLLLLDRVAHIAKAAQDAGAELSSALTRAMENQRRRAHATHEPLVLLRPSPQQYVESATDLLDAIPALCQAIQRDSLTTFNMPASESR
ncbi:hypothetical protein [Streptomyces sp. NBC_00203]|uniref:hypothetical protein n=1 Tax=Streptomyces sp. NBC_00203 TaxID=2975680 RepID=UPI00324AA6CA